MTSNIMAPKYFLLSATCGDGYVQLSLGETCDLGPANANAGECTSTCAAAVCGDGPVFAGHEECDDGNVEYMVRISPCRSNLII